MTSTNTHDSAESQARRLESVLQQLESLLLQPGVAQRLRTPPGADEWSAMQILGHMAEMIPYWLSHCRTMIEATGEPPYVGRPLDAPERLEGVAHGASSDPDAIIHKLREEIHAAATTIRAMLPAERAAQGIHMQRGEVTVADVIDATIVTHAESHLAQVRRTLEMKKLDF